MLSRYALATSTALLTAATPAQARAHHCNPVYVPDAKVRVLAGSHTSCAVARAGVKKGWYIQAHRARLGTFRFNLRVHHHSYRIKATFYPPSAGGGRLHAKFVDRKRHISFEASS